MKVLLCFLSLALLLTSCSTSKSKNQLIVGYDAELSTFEYPYTVNFFEFNSQNMPMKMAYMDIRPQGEVTKTVVMFHGKNFSGYYFEPIIRELTKKGMRVIVPDQVGFGKSTKPDYYQYSFQVLAQNTKNLLKSLNVDEFTLVGHSMGGMLATRFSLMYPEMVKKLILVNMIGLEDYKLLTPFKGFDDLYQDELKNNEEKIRDYQVKFYYDGQWKEEYEAMIKPAVGWTKGPDSKLVALNAALTSELIYTQPVVHEFSKLKMKTTLINGLRDKTAPGKSWAPIENQKLMGNYPELSKKAAKLIPHSKLITMKGLGHMPFVEDFNGFMKHFVPEL